MTFPILKFVEMELGYPHVKIFSGLPAQSWLWQSGQIVLSEGCLRGERCRRLK